MEASGKRKGRLIADIVINLLIILTTAWAVSDYFFSGPDILGSVGKDSLKYFTTDSNILMAVTSVIWLIYALPALKDPDKTIPRWVMLFKFVGTAAVTVTLLTVVFFLAPMGYLRGGWKTFFFFFEGNIFVLHFLAPVLAILSLCLFEKKPAFSGRSCLWAMVPTVIYSLIYLVMVVFVGRWTDWYGFTFGGKYYLAPFAMLAMYALTYGIAFVLERLRRK